MIYSYGLGIDWIIIIITFVITFGAQGYINSTYRKTRKIKSKSNMSGAEVARKILDSNNLFDVRVVETRGFLSDHYDPKNKVVRLSSDVYSNSSIASISVAAHEVGHAIQDKNGYFFLRLRSSIIPFVNIASSLGYVAMLIGLFMSSMHFFRIGILLEMVILFFQLVTLPVEFNASHRALVQLEELSIVDSLEKRRCFSMLRAAAFTYVAAVLTAILEIVRLIMISKNDE